MFDKEYNGNFNRDRREKPYFKKKYEKQDYSQTSPEHLERIDSRTFNKYDRGFKGKPPFNKEGSWKRNERFRPNKDRNAEHDNLSKRLGGNNESSLDNRAREEHERSDTERDKKVRKRDFSRSPNSPPPKSPQRHENYQNRLHNRFAKNKGPFHEGKPAYNNAKKTRPPFEKGKNHKVPTYDDQNPERTNSQSADRALSPPPGSPSNSSNHSDLSINKSLPNGRSKIKISLGGRRDNNVPRGPSAYDRGPRNNRGKQYDSYRNTGDRERFNKNPRENQKRGKERRPHSRDPPTKEHGEGSGRNQRRNDIEYSGRPGSRTSTRSDEKSESRRTSPSHHSDAAPTEQPTEQPAETNRDISLSNTNSKVQYGVIEYSNDSVYKRVSQIGEGTYGKVYKAINTQTDVMVALKRLRMETEKDGFPITAMREIKLLQGLRHPCIVSLLEMMVEKSQVYMVFEYLDHDLAGILSHPTLSFTHSHVKYMFKQLVEGIDYMHKHGVLHRDLKGSNILLSNSGQVKIADFGLARSVDLLNPNALYTNRVITLWYRPPELLLGETKYNGAVDIWGLGCILAEFFVRKALFQGHDEIAQIKAIYSVLGTPAENGWQEARSLPWYQLVPPKEPRLSQFKAKLGERIPVTAHQLVEKMLTLNPAHRITANDILADEYFKTEPIGSRPTQLEELTEEWHDFEAKQRRRKKKDGKEDSQKLKITR